MGQDVGLVSRCAFYRNPFLCRAHAAGRVSVMVNIQSIADHCILEFAGPPIEDTIDDLLVDLFK